MGRFRYFFDGEEEDDDDCRRRDDDMEDAEDDVVMEAVEEEEEEEQRQREFAAPSNEGEETAAAAVKRAQDDGGGTLWRRGESIGGGAFVRFRGGTFRNDDDGNATAAAVSNSNYFLFCPPPPRSSSSGHEEEEEEEWTVSAVEDESNGFFSLKRRRRRRLRPCPGDDGDDDERTKRRRRRRRRRNNGLVAAACAGLAAAYWIRAEGPPGPPPPIGGAGADWRGDMSSDSYHHDHHYYYYYPTWNEYLSSHAGQWWNSTTALAYETPAHLLDWFWQCRVADFERLRYYYNAYAGRGRWRWWPFRSSSLKNNGSNNNNDCPIRPTVVALPDNSILGILSDRVVGQPAAVRATARALRTWRPLPSSSSPLQSQQQRRQEEPLVLWFAGYSGSGKRTLARRAAELLFTSTTAPTEDDDDKSNYTTAASACTRWEDRILTLDGADYARHHRPRDYYYYHYDDNGGDDEDAVSRQRQYRSSWNYYRSLEHQILVRGGASTETNGAVVVVRNAEYVPAPVLHRILQQLKRRRRLPGDGAAASDDDSLFHSLRGCCNHTVFIFTTSSIGVKSIARSLRLGDERLEQPGFALDLEHEIDSHFSSLPQEKQISSYLDAVVPFVPLTEPDLSTLLQREFAIDESFPSLRITPSAADAFVGPNYVEYLEWTHGDAVVRTFASQGAKALQSVRRTIQAHVSKCLVQEGGDNPRSQPTDDEVHVLDVIESKLWSSWTSSTTISPEGVLRLCSRGEKASTFDDSSCREVCRFSL